MTAVYGNPDAPFVLVQMVGEWEGLNTEISEIRKRTDADFCLMPVQAADWNTDLSPWPAPAVFGGEDFGGGAAAMLDETLKSCTDQRKTYLIGGYSLAGLFALWAACRTDAFRGVAAASPSVWFPGFADYLRENRMRAQAVCLSLGDREEKTRNPFLASVGDRIREAHALLNAQGISTALMWNPGNHFKDADIRTAKAFAWVLNQLNK